MKAIAEVVVQLSSYLIVLLRGFHMQCLKEQKKQRQTIYSKNPIDFSF